MRSSFTAVRIIATREIAARWILWPIALVLAILAVAVPLGVSTDDQISTAQHVSLAMWFGSFIVSAVIGLSLLGPELSEGRLSFYFTRPFSSGQIFAGKLLGGAVLALLTQIIFLVTARVALPGATGNGLGWETAFACVVSVALGLAAGVAIHARTVWLVLDLAGLVVIGTALGFVLFRVGETPAARIAVLEHASLVVALAALSLAGARALRSGRTDRGRVHAVLSATLWSIVVPASAAVIALAWHGL